ncbi:MAG: glycosyl hydrolase, partial [Chitinophagaceae bacterium]
FMFGHQDDLAYGVGWKYEEGRSDIWDVTEDYPAVYGWELGHLEIDHATNLDSVPFNTMQQLIKQGYERGGVITISWHLDNPLTGKSAWVPAEGTVASILPGGSKHDLYKNWLDKLAGFMNGLTGSRGEFIPVIFRPYHELNGNWFWWGGKNCTPDEFKKLWSFTVTYLRDVKKLHHLLYAYNTDRFGSREEYLAKYPGDEYVDVIGFDIYQRNSPNDVYTADIDRMLTTLEEIAKEKKKLPALTEFGGNLSDNNWWTGTFLKVLSKHNISYALGWRNAGGKPGGQFEFYVPYKGHATAPDFESFYKADRTLFQKDVSKEKLYQ